jgi:hypothetical protein
MQSPTIGAIRGLSVLIFLFLFSTSLIAQNKGIVIKERVEIAPKSTISSSWWCGADSIIYSSSKKMTILVSYGVGWHTRINNLGFSPYGSIGGSTDELFTLYTYQVGSYFLYEPTEPMTSINLVLYSEDPGSGDPYCYVYYGDGDFDLQNTPMVAFGSGDGWGECVGTPWFAYSISIPVNIIGIPPPVCPPGYHLGQMGTYDVQYGETTNIFTETLNGCGHHVDEPPESYFKYELVDDTLSRTLRDLTTGRTGAVLDSVGSSVIEFNTWGKEPKEPETITLKVSSVNGTIDPAIVPINVYPPEVRAIPGKSNLIYGDTTSLIIQVRQPGGNWMPMPYDWYGIYTIMQADTFGFLYNMDSTIMGPRISNHDPKIKFAANPETEPDSVEVLIQLFAIEPCYSCGVGKIMPSDPMNLGSNRQIKNSSLVNQRLKSKILMKASSLMLKQQLQNNISKKAASLTASSIRINDNSHYGLAKLVVKKRTIKHFCQGDYPNVRYDDYVKKDKNGNIIKDKDGNPVYYSVGDKGCALTCMAMIAYAGGADIDPGTLASDMREHGGFTGQGVNWDHINNYHGNLGFARDTIKGNGLKLGEDGKTVDFQKSISLALSSMDQYLDQGYLIIAQVYNPTTKGNHWVLVTDKDNNDYSIIDPGCYSDRDNLSAYGSVYKFVVYKKL